MSDDIGDIPDDLFSETIKKLEHIGYIDIPRSEWEARNIKLVYQVWNWAKEMSKKLA
jgi:hypothetical protein